MTTVPSSDHVMDSFYCIYSGEHIAKEHSTREHIIPLSLGGANGFEIRVARDVNSRLGTEVDGAMANDFLLHLRRAEHKAKGHGRKAPVPRLKHSAFTDCGTPIQVDFTGAGLVVFSPKEGRLLETGEVADRRIQSSFLLDTDSKLRFIAKVALGAGSFIYGDLFRDDVRCDELRFLMNFDRSGDSPERFHNIGTLGWWWPMPVADKDAGQLELHKHFARFLDCSYVIAIPGPRNLGFFVGILGELVGFLNVPAKTDGFPVAGDHDLGHVVALRNATVSRFSYRRLAELALEAIAPLSMHVGGGGTGGER